MFLLHIFKRTIYFLVLIINKLVKIKFSSNKIKL
jgi:hypothetical protein